MKDLFTQGSITFHCPLLNFEMFFSLEIKPKRFFSFLRVYMIKQFFCIFIFYNFKSIFLFFFDKFDFSWLSVSDFICTPNFRFVFDGVSFFKTNLCLKISIIPTWIIQPHIVCFIRQQLTKSFFTTWSNGVFVEHCFLHECFNNCNITRCSFKPQICSTVCVRIIIKTVNRDWIIQRIFRINRRLIDYWINMKRNQQQSFHVYFHKIKSNNVLVHFSFLYSFGCFRL